MMRQRARQYRHAYVLKCGLAALLLSLLPITGCGEKPSSKAAAAPLKGVVGKVLSVKGKVSYSVAPSTERKPLAPGMELRAEWTVHTGRDAELTAQLKNGHRWTLAEDLSKRVSGIRALTLAPVKEGAVAQLSDLGGGGGKDRSAAAGLHQERTAGSKAAPTRAPSPEPATLDETAPTGGKPAPMTTAPMGLRIRRRGKKKTRTTPKTTSRNRSGNRSYRSATMRPPRRRAPLDGLIGGGARPGGGGNRGGGTTVTSRLRGPASKPAPAKSERESLPKRLTSAQLAKVVGAHKGRLRACLRTHKITATLTIRIMIRGAQGRVSTVRVAGQSSSAPVVRCLRGRLRAMQFPKFTTKAIPYTIRLKAR